MAGLNAGSGAEPGLMMAVIATDPTRRAGRFNLTLGVQGVAISIGAPVSTFFAGRALAAFGARLASIGLALVGLRGLVPMWLVMPVVRPPVGETIPDTGPREC